MLNRARLVRELLDRGISVMLFDADQVRCLYPQTYQTADTVRQEKEFKYAWHLRSTLAQISLGRSS